MLYPDKNRSISILMLPWLGHGHISPFLELGKKLTSHRDFHIFICSTPVNLSSIKPKLPKKYSHFIEFVELHLPHDELPPHYHTTNGLPPHLMPTLKKAFDMSSDNFSHILKTLKPDLLIYDFLQPWAPSLALSHNIPAVEFTTTSAASMSLFLHHHKNPNVQFPYPSIYLRDYETKEFSNVLESSANGITNVERVLLCSDLSRNIILVKTSGEIESKCVDYLSQLTEKKIVPVGSLVQDPMDQQVDEESSIIKWLNERERASVVFVSFGSEYFLSKEEIQEIALGLELSQVSFIWVIRFPKEDKSTRVEDVLPKGFGERVEERGMIVDDWTPQAKILKHSSVGGFVSHCGWSSVLESIKFGVPIIAMPMQLDQPVNARLVVEVGVGVEAIRTGGGGSLQREEVAKNHSSGWRPPPGLAIQLPWLRNGCLFILAKVENETPGWTQLKLPGQAPSARWGHTITSGGHYFTFNVIVKQVLGLTPDEPQTTQILEDFLTFMRGLISDSEFTQIL